MVLRSCFCIFSCAVLGYIVRLHKYLAVWNTSPATMPRVVVDRFGFWIEYFFELIFFFLAVDEPVYGRLFVLAQMVLPKNGCFCFWPRTCFRYGRCFLLALFFLLNVLLFVCVCTILPPCFRLLYYAGLVQTRAHLHTAPPNQDTKAGCMLAPLV